MRYKAKVWLCSLPGQSIPGSLGHVIISDPLLFPAHCVVFMPPMFSCCSFCWNPSSPSSPASLLSMPRTSSVAAQCVLLPLCILLGSSLLPVCFQTWSFPKAEWVSCSSLYNFGGAQRGALTAGSSNFLDGSSSPLLKDGVYWDSWLQTSVEWIAFLQFDTNESHCTAWAALPSAVLLISPLYQVQPCKDIGHHGPGPRGLSAARPTLEWN